MVKISIFSCLKKHHFTEVGFDTSEENLLSCFQNGYFFKILWWCHEPFNQVKCWWKNENDFWTFYQQKNWFKFVSFLTDQSLHRGPHSIISGRISVPNTVENIEKFYVFYKIEIRQIKTDANLLCTAVMDVKVKSRCMPGQ